MKLLIDERGRKYLTNEEELHTNLGVVDIKGANVGDVVKSHLGHKFWILSPRVVDFYEKMPRAGSFILKKDMGLILAYTGVSNGDIVVDAGTGSAALAIFLANIVKPGGKVYTYEKREEFAEIARKNIKMAGLSDYIELRIKDIAEGVDEEADVITLDLHEPWKVVPAARKALKLGGYIAIYTPYIEQAKKVVKSLRGEGFKDIKTIETIEREIEFKKQGTRPKTSMVGHTGYLTFARKY